MKFNWGTGIALVYATFVAGMLFAVIRSTRHDPGLVSKNYYDLDLNYQEHLVKKQNAANLPGGLPIRYVANAQQIEIAFPTELGAPAGKIKMFRSATVKSDLLLDIQTRPDGRMIIPADDLPKGIWRIEVDWEAGSKSYFNEARVTVTHA